MPILSWLTRDRDVRAADAVPYRLLERDAALSAGTPASGNMLIQGDNLEALKSLLPYSAEHGFRFADGMFDGVPAYRGSYRFTKHFLPAIPAFDSGEDGEELSAAKQLDAVPEVDTWVRNVANHPAAFWLPLATGRTYPDFVARLKDGRLLIVEYKGGHLVRDAVEKRLAGELWERSGGGLYVFAERERDGLNVRDQIRRAIGRS